MRLARTLEDLCATLSDSLMHFTGIGRRKVNINFFYDLPHAHGLLPDSP